MDDVWTEYDDATTLPAGTLCLTFPASSDHGPERVMVATRDASDTVAIDEACMLCEEQGRCAKLWRVDSNDTSTTLYTITADGVPSLVGV